MTVLWFFWIFRDFYHFLWLLEFFPIFWNFFGFFNFSRFWKFEKLRLFCWPSLVLSIKIETSGARISSTTSSWTLPFDPGNSPGFPLQNKRHLKFLTRGPLLAPLGGGVLTSFSRFFFSKFPRFLNISRFFWMFRYYLTILWLLEFFLIFWNFLEFFIFSRFWKFEKSRLFCWPSLVLSIKIETWGARISSTTSSWTLPFDPGNSPGFPLQNKRYLKNLTRGPLLAPLGGGVLTSFFAIFFQNFPSFLNFSRIFWKFHDFCDCFAII